MKNEKNDLKTIIKNNGDFIITIRDLFFVFYKYKIWIILPCILMAVISVIIVIQSKKTPVKYAIIKPKYISKAVIIIPTSPYINVNSLSLEQEFGNAVNDSGINIKGINTVELSNELIRTNLVIDPVIKKYKLLEIYNISKLSECRKKIKNNLNFNYTVKKRNAVEKKLIITMYFSDNDSIRAKNILSDIIANLNEQLIKISQKKSADNIIFLEKRLNDVNKKIVEVENELLLLQKDFDIKNINNKISNDQLSIYLNKQQKLKREYISLEKISDIIFSQYELNKLKYNDSPQIIIIEEPNIPDNSGNLSLMKVLVINTGSAFFISLILIYIFYIVLGRKKIHNKVK